MAANDFSNGNDRTYGVGCHYIRRRNPSNLLTIAANAPVKLKISAAEIGSGSPSPSPSTGDWLSAQAVPAPINAPTNAPTTSAFFSLGSNSSIAPLPFHLNSQHPRSPRLYTNHALRFGISGKPKSCAICCRSASSPKSRMAPFWFLPNSDANHRMSCAGSSGRNSRSSLCSWRK